MEQQNKHQETASAAERHQLSPLARALFIGFLAGVIGYSVVANTWGLLTLIPLYLIYRMVKGGNDRHGDQSREA